jgi:hypothetical protein
LPRIGIRVRLADTSNPVPSTIVSQGRSTPSEVTTPVGVTRVIGVVTTSTFGRDSAG